MSVVEIRGNVDLGMKLYGRTAGRVKSARACLEAERKDGSIVAICRKTLSSSTLSGYGYTKTKDSTSPKSSLTPR